MALLIGLAPIAARAQAAGRHDGAGVFSPENAPRPKAETRVRVGPLAAGALMFGVPYLAGVVGALSNLQSSLPPNELFIPIVGPFVELARVLPGADGSPSEGLGFDPASRAVAAVGFILDGALQYAGLLLLLYAAFDRKHTTVAESSPGVTPIPLVGAVNGLALSATF